MITTISQLCLGDFAYNFLKFTLSLKQRSQAWSIACSKEANIVGHSHV